MNHCSSLSKWGFETYFTSLGANGYLWEKIKLLLLLLLLLLFIVSGKVQAVKFDLFIRGVNVQKVIIRESQDTLSSLLFIATNYSRLLIHVCADCNNTYCNRRERIIPQFYVTSAQGLKTIADNFWKFSKYSCVRQKRLHPLKNASSRIFTNLTRIIKYLYVTTNK